MADVALGPITGEMSANNSPVLLWSHKPDLKNDRLPMLTWLLHPQHPAIEQGTTDQGQLRPERERLNQAWTAYASADFQRARQALPSQLADFGNSDWSFAAEAALIYSLIHYSCGELEASLTHARMAQSGLSGQARDCLLLPTLMVQAQIAFHRRNRDYAESIWQVAAHLPTTSDVEMSWKESIAAIAHLSKGNLDQSATDAENAIEHSDSVGPHLAPLTPWIISAKIARERGESHASDSFVERGLIALDDFPALPILTELTALKAHIALDEPHGDIAEAIESVAALSAHDYASPELQDHIDFLEAGLRIRTHETTRARILVDRMDDSQRRTLLEVSLDAETRPSRTLGVLAAGRFRWYRDQIEVDIIRARARRKDLHAAAMQMWRAIELAAETGIVRPFLDTPLAAANFSNPAFLEELEATCPDSALEAHLEKILQTHAGMALRGPESHALSARELEILRAVAAGGDFTTVAKMLVLSRWTVRGHFYSACKKLGVSGREAAIARLREIETPRPPSHSDES